MKTGIMQTGCCHPAKYEIGWDIFYGDELTITDVANLKREGWEPWLSDHRISKEVWIRPTPTTNLPEVVAEEGGPDD